MIMKYLLKKMPPLPIIKPKINLEINLLTSELILCFCLEIL